ncbi:TIGR02117 family protein [Sphingomonas panaciterrae]|uniref:TIGR02117 family protein n=1 Tax=Sphingomonas panaciterrae TaxID=1462999 RepID=UPI002FEE6E11
MRRRPLLILVAVVLALVAYPLAGMVGGVLPANREWVAPAQGITLYVESNGIHTGIIMPKLAAGVDWRPYFPARDLRDPRFAAYDHVSVGWGEHDFYLETPTWADLRPGVVVAAAIGSNRTLVHVDHLPAPSPTGEAHRLVVTPAQYRRLAAFIQASLVPGGAHYPGYFGNDAFYEARGRYDAIHTCNAWVGEALRFAGVRVGRWTPFPATVMWWFPRHD